MPTYLTPNYLHLYAPIFLNSSVKIMILSLPMLWYITIYSHIPVQSIIHHFILQKNNLMPRTEPKKKHK